MKKLKEMLTDKKFWFFILISILFFGSLVKLEYATDTYAVFQTPSRDIIKHFFVSGRFITAIAQIIVVVLHMSNNLQYAISFMLAIVCTSVSIYKLENILDKEIKSKYIAAVAAILIIINIFSIELYLFIEKGILMLSVLFSVLAFESIVKYFKGNKKAIIATIVYMLLANFSYQGTVGLFVLLTLLYIVKHTKDVKEFIKNNIITALCYGIPAIINYIIVKFIFNNNRVSGESNIMQSVTKIIESSKYMIATTYEIIPRYLFIGIVFLLIALIAYFVITSKNEKKSKVLLLLGIAYVILGNFIVTIFPQIMQSTDSIWFVPRSTYAFASLIGLLVAYLFMNTAVKEQIRKLIFVALIVYMSIQYIGFQNIIRDRYIVNYMDAYTCEQIEEKILSYEKETGNIITKVAYYEAVEREYSYPNLYVNHDTNIKAMYPEWSRLQALNQYLNRNFTQTDEVEEVYNKYFKERKWKYYSDEQIILIGDTAHIYIY